MARSLAILLVALLIFSNASAQFTNADLNAMVATEEAFIKMAKEKNTRDAFLFFLHDDAVTVGPYGLVTGKEQLKKQPLNDSWLSWSATYCDISSGGDLGYNVGPWKFFAHRADSLPVAWGHFHSIWRKQTDGTWKNMLDFGISHDSLEVSGALHTSSIPLKAPKVRTPALEATVSLMNQEKSFLAAVNTEGLNAYNKFASKEIRFARQGDHPIVTAADKAAFLKRKSLYFNQVLVDGGIASSGDLGYVYGTADALAFVDDKQETKQAVYLRIWKKEDGKNWKIVLDVMTFR